MRFISTSRALLALVAVFALSAVTVASASAALPEFKPVPTKNKLTGSGTTMKIKFLSNTISCKANASTGEITGARTAGKVVLTFTGCVMEGSRQTGCPVHTLGAKSGEVITHALKGELGSVATKEAASGVGLLIKPESGTLIARLEEEAGSSGCGLGEPALRGNFAAEVATIGKKQATNTLVVKPIKKITVEGGEVETHLELGGYLPSIEFSNAVTFEEALEVT